jgi:hypothetical protein
VSFCHHLASVVCLADLKKSSLLKLLCQMNWNLIGSIYGKSSTNQKQELSVADMFINGSGRNEQSLQRTFQRCFLPGYGSFGQTVSEDRNFKNRPIRNKNCLDPLTNMAATDDSCFWLADFLNSSLKPFGQINYILVGNIFERSSVKIAHFLPIR